MNFATTDSTVQTSLGNFNCHKLTPIANEYGESTYIHYETSENDKAAIIVHVNGRKKELNTSLAIENYRKTICKKYEGKILPERIMIVVHATPRQMLLSGKNLILVGERDSVVKIKHLDPGIKILGEYIAASIGRNENLALSNKSVMGFRYNPKSAKFLFVIIAILSFITYGYSLVTYSNPWEINSLFAVSIDRVLRQHEIYRLFTYMFAHGSFTHYMSNMMFLFVYGNLYVQREGTFDFTLTYFAGGILAGIATIYGHLMMGYSDYYSVGASGALFALMGAYLMSVLLSDSDNKLGTIGLCIAIGLATYFTGNGAEIDHICHISGFVIGVGIQTVFRILGTRSNGNNTERAYKYHQKMKELERMYEKKQQN